MTVQFGVQRLEDLGHGSLQQLLNDAASQPTSIITSACALACGADSSAAGLTLAGQSQRARQFDTAKAALASAPFFADLTQW